MLNRILGYCRISCKEKRDKNKEKGKEKDKIKKEEENSLGLDAQIASLKEYCLKHNKNLDHIYSEENVSGDSDPENRVQLSLLLKSLKKGDTLLVKRRCRLARSFLAMTKIESYVKKIGAHIIACDTEHLSGTDATSELFRNLIDSINIFERKNAIERTKCAMLELKKRHKKTGVIPFGFREENGLVVVDNCEQILVDKILKAKSDGMRCYCISQMLNAEGFVKRNGNPWSYRNVKLIIDNYPSHQILRDPIVT